MKVKVVLEEILPTDEQKDYHLRRQNWPQQTPLLREAEIVGWCTEIRSKSRGKHCIMFIACNASGGDQLSSSAWIEIDGGSQRKNDWYFYWRVSCHCASLWNVISHQYTQDLFLRVPHTRFMRKSWTDLDTFGTFWRKDELFWQLENRRLFFKIFAEELACAVWRGCACIFLGTQLQSADVP